MQQAILHLFISLQKYHFEYYFLSPCIAKTYLYGRLTKHVLVAQSDLSKVENSLWENEINDILTYFLQIIYTCLLYHKLIITTIICGHVNWVCCFVVDVIIWNTKFKT